MADGPRSGMLSGDKHQSAPSAVALTDETLIAPEQNSMPALTHLHGRRICGLPPPNLFDRTTGTVSEDIDWGALPAKMTKPPWSHSISKSAVTVTSATKNGFRNEVNTMGAVEVSPFGGFRQRSVFGPAVRVKYSMHCGSVKSAGKFNAVNDEPLGGILTLQSRARGFQPPTNSTDLPFPLSLTWRKLVGDRVY